MPDQEGFKVDTSVKGYLDGYSVLITRHGDEDIASTLDYVGKLVNALKQRGYLPSWNELTNKAVLGGNGQIEAPKEEKKEAGEAIPICPTHNKQMVKRQGQWGDFWACPTKLDDGTWCKFRPKKK